MFFTATAHLSPPTQPNPEFRPQTFKKEGKNMKKKTAWVWLNEKVSVLSVFDIGTDGCASYHPEFPKGQL